MGAVPGKPGIFNPVLIPAYTCTYSTLSVIRHALVVYVYMCALAVETLHLVFTIVSTVQCHCEYRSAVVSTVPANCLSLTPGIETVSTQINNQVSNVCTFDKLFIVL